MIKKFNFLVFPVLTVIFLLLAWISGGKDFLTIVKGETADGVVTALVRCYDEERCDLIVDIQQELTLTRADGTSFSATADRTGIRNADQYSEKQRAALDAVTGVKTDSIKRFLLREEDKEGDDRIRSVTRTERTRLLQSLPGPIDRIELTENGRVASVHAGGRVLQAEDSDLLVTQIQAAYIGGTEKAEKLKTDVITEASRTLNGEPIDHESEDFVLYETDYHYVFRPVFTYTGEVGPVAAVADIGARKSPRGGHRIGDSMLIAYVPSEPGRATILSDFGQLKELSLLDAINRFFEITFGRWFFPAVSLLVALVYLIMSVISVPLMLKPPKTEHADTVDEEALAKMD